MLNIITGLPSRSHLGSAQAQDDELYRMLHSDDDPSAEGPPRTPRVEDIGEAELLLMSLVTRVQDVVNAVMTTNQQKAVKYPPVTMPETAETRHHKAIVRTRRHRARDIANEARARYAARHGEG